MTDQHTAPKFPHISVPSEGERIRWEDGRLLVPDRPIIPSIEGDGIGPDIWQASRMVFDAAVDRAYQGRRAIAWAPAMAGERAQAETGTPLPGDTVEALRYFHVAIKGPLTTPVGGGYQSLNVTIRRTLDLYACIRPVRYLRGVPSPMRAPEKLDVIIYRENTEDVYAGIEYEAGSPESEKLRAFLQDELGAQIRSGSGIGIKPISEFGTKRLVAKAIQGAMDRGRRSVTLVHKGNIMKFTEGAFRDWAYEVARDRFGEVTVTEDELWERHDGRLPEGRLLIKDRIADSMFQQVLLRPDEYEVIALPNLNGDYLSDACAAQVGGLGMAPGANVGDEVAVFEATHGTAPKYTGQNKVNPGSLILSGAMMLEHLGWDEPACLILAGIEGAIQAKTVTYDLARQMEGATEVSTSGFAEAVIAHMPEP